MATTLITLEDLQNFKQELLVEIQNLFYRIKPLQLASA